jgi:hypothetical protein
MRRMSYLFLLGIILLMSPAAYAQKVSTDFDKAANFAAYKTYAWAQGTPAKNPLFDQRITQGIEARLGAKGLTKSASAETADLLITYHAAVDVETQINSYNTGGWGYGYGWGWGGGGGMTTTNVQKIPVGQLVVDFADLKAKKFVWRGTASSTLSSKPEKAENTINKALDKMFENYPPKGK